MGTVKLFFALSACCVAILNAATKGEIRWLIPAYWTIVSIYWMGVVFL